MQRVARQASAALDSLTAGNRRPAGSCERRPLVSFVTPRLLAAVAALALAATGACGRSNGAAADSARGSAVRGVFASSGAGDYSTVTISTPGAIRGTVTITGDIPEDSLVHPTSDVSTCGAELVNSAIDHNGPLLAGAVVWLDGIRAGKPLPLVRRYDVINEGCLVTPRVQAAIMGGTLNVRSRDPVTHRTRLVRAGETKPIALVTETDEGQVVPLDHALEVPGQIEIRCDQHPWTRGYIAVFDHPYFAVTTANGDFELDSVPPGKYTLKVWHERLGTTSREVNVVGGGTATADVEMKVRRGAGE